MTQDQVPHVVNCRRRRIFLAAALLVCMAIVALVWWQLGGTSRLEDLQSDAHLQSWLAEARRQIDRIENPEQRDEQKRMYISAAAICGCFRLADQAIRDWMPSGRNDAWTAAAKHCIAANRLDYAKVAIAQIGNRKVQGELRRQIGRAQQQKTDSQADAGDSKDERRRRWAQAAALLGMDAQAAEILATVQDQTLRSQVSLDLTAIRQARQQGDQALWQTIAHPYQAIAGWIGHLAEAGEMELARQATQNVSDPQQRLRMQSRMLRAAPEADGARQLARQCLDALAETAADDSQGSVAGLTAANLLEYFVKSDNPDLADQALNLARDRLEPRRALPLTVRTFVRLDMPDRADEAIAEANPDPDTAAAVVRILSRLEPDLVLPVVRRRSDPAERSNLLLAACLVRSRELAWQ